jgi:hypothetical protein
MPALSICDDISACGADARAGGTATPRARLHIIRLPHLPLMDESTWYWPLLAGALGSALLMFTALLAMILLVLRAAAGIARDDRE